MCIRDFLRTYGLRVDFSFTPLPTIQCENDEFLMDALRERGMCTATELQRLNACRMWLQVARISDISSSDGKFLRIDCLTGIKTQPFRSQTKWPRQGRPPKQWWALWKRKVQRVLSSNGSSLTLRHSLGQWTEDINVKEWEVVYSGMSGTPEVFCRQLNGEYDVFRGEVGNCGTHAFVSAVCCGIVDRCPADSVPASLGQCRKDGRQRVSFRSRKAPLQHNDTDVNSFQAYVARQAPYIRTILQHANLSDETAAAVAATVESENTLHCGSDGGLLNGIGTFGFVWANASSREVIASGKGYVPGHIVGMSSTRAELCGIFAALLYLELATKYHHLVLPRQAKMCTVYCDSSAALQRISKLSYDSFGTTWRCRANYDLEAAINARLQSSRMQFSWIWVKGHARRRKKPFEFTWPETLNDHADSLATTARDDALTPDKSHWPEQAISIAGPRGRISGRLDHEIRYCCTANDLQSYWQQRYNWTAAQAAYVDIVGTKAAAKTLQPDTARRIQKLRCGWLPVNNREARSDPDRPSGCSACSPANLVPETVDHIFQCTETSRRRAILERFSTFFDYFRSMKTANSIISAIQAGAVAWVEQRDPPSVDSLNLPDNRIGQLTRQAYLEQTSLGWNVLFRGFWATSWRLAQEEQFRTYRSRERQDSGERWAARAHLWFYDTFNLLWGLRNDAEHGDDKDTQRLIRIAKCERAIRRLYDKGKDLPYAERHPFRDPIEDLLQQPIQMQELWIDKTEAYLRKAFQRERARPRGQPAITNFFARLHG
jgi:ribonuclease HI